jgi:GTP pyrophosphokinase
MYKPDLEQEEKEMLNKYKHIKYALTLRGKLSEEDTAMIKKAYSLAVTAHKDMRRKSGEPYIYHPLDVAYICVSEIGLGVTSVVCALLHDVVEDTDYTLDDIRTMFSDKVAAITDGLTKVSDFLDMDSKAITAVNLQKIVMALVQDVRVILIKLADRLHNMRTLESLPEQKQIKISRETTLFFAPLAHRLGLYSIKSELEDLAFKYTNPTIYNRIYQELETVMEKYATDIQKFIAPIKKTLSTMGYRVDIKSRSKSISSIYEKMQRKQLPFEEIYDIFAVRIILDVPVDTEKRSCWDAYSIVTTQYRPKPGRLRDWISTPKSNGYQALHTTVMSHFGRWVEVQIRSTRMDEIAEKGYAAHWKYKEGVSMENSNMDNWLNRIRDMLETSNPDAIDFLENFLGFLFVDEVFVFTPKGEARILPNGSTVLDFAYAIHSEKGNKCIGAEVNHQLKPITYKLHNGDQVNILDSNAQQPNDDWLDIAITTRARTSINNALKEQKKQFLPEGEKKLEKLFKEVHLEWNKENKDRLVELSGKNNLTDLFYDTATGKFTIQEMKTCLQQDSSNWLQKINPFIRKQSSLQEIAIQWVQHLGTTEKAMNKEFIIASCCNPIPGDDIIAVATKQNIPVIHRIGCKNVTEPEPSRDTFVIKTLWKDNTQQTFLTGIYIDGFDKKGFIYELSKMLFDELDVNIKSFDIEANAGVYTCYIMLFVENTKKLDSIIDSLKKLDGIKKVVRVDNKK